MADKLISANALGEQVERLIKPKSTEAACVIGDVLALIEDAPSVDAVPVVRCEKCKYFTQYDGINIGSCGRLCDEWNKRTTDYCSWGERREDDE